MLEKKHHEFHFFETKPKKKMSLKEGVFHIALICMFGMPCFFISMQSSVEKKIDKSQQEVKSRNILVNGMHFNTGLKQVPGELQESDYYYYLH